MNFAPSRIDAALGTVIERTVCLHHARRLRRLGWSRALQPGRPQHGGAWADGDPPPRPGSRVEVLIDGAQALPTIADALAGAREYVHLTGWHVMPGFELVRGEPPITLGRRLAELAERIEVRLLVWAGSPVPAFHPTRKEVGAAIETLTRQTRIRCEPDPREHPVHCHHEKTIVIDGELAFVGGIDLTSDGGDRFDSSEHLARRRLGWHDVATRLRGPAVKDVADHFAMRWHEVTAETLPTAPMPADAGDSTVQVVRTVAEDMYRALPRGEFRILESYVRALSSADTSSTWRTSSCGRPRSSGSSLTSSASRRRRTSGSSCCCPPRPTTATTTRVGRCRC